MRISRGHERGRASEKRSGGATFTGGVWADPVLVDQDGVLANSVFFEPGGRTHWHSHGYGQVLHVTHGEGYIQSRDGQGFPLTPGDVVHIPAGEEHWHGAGPDTYVLHLAISIGGADWLEPVSDEDYASVFR
jgi:quercetin dioxygenase-like cupin family protein